MFMCGFDVINNKLMDVAQYRIILHTVVVLFQSVLFLNAKSRPISSRYQGKVRQNSSNCKRRDFGGHPVQFLTNFLITRWRA